MTEPTYAELRDTIATGCRVLAARDLAPGILGHISVRIDESRLLVRCRGPQERGLGFTEPGDIRLVTMTGEPGAPGELDGDYRVPAELPLHTRILARRPDVDCVVHAHPRDVVAANLAGLPIVPLVGAYDIPGAALAHGGVAQYPRSALIHTDALGEEVADAIDQLPVVIMRGHGLTATGRSVEEAVLRASSIATIASLSLSVASAGGTVRPIPPEDLADLPDLGGRLNLDTAWRHEVARLPQIG